MRRVTVLAPAGARVRERGEAEPRRPTKRVRVCEVTSRYFISGRERPTSIKGGIG